MEAKNFIVNTNFNISKTIHRMYFNVFACKKYHFSDFTYKIRIHSDLNEYECKVDTNNEIEGVFIAISDFAKYWNFTKETLLKNNLDN
jgi:hypothetical protein